MATSYSTGAYGAGSYSDALIWPLLFLDWAPNDPPTAEFPVWMDISSRLQSWEWSYGRNDELGDFEAGSGYVVLDNQDRALDPSNTVGPWYGLIKPRRLFRLRAVWNGVSYPIFVGHAKSYPQQYPDGLSKLVRIDLADMLALLQPVDLDALGFDRPEERTDERLDAILDEADIPDSWRDYPEGDYIVAAITDGGDSGSAVNAATNTVVWSEGIPLYVNHSGNIAY